MSRGSIAVPSVVAAPVTHGGGFPRSRCAVLRHDVRAAVVHTAVMAPEPDLPVDVGRTGDGWPASATRCAAVTAWPPRAARRLDDTTVAGALLGASGQLVTLHTGDGVDALTGTVTAVGADLVELRGPSTQWWVRLQVIAAVEVAVAPRPGDPKDRSAVELVDLLCELVDRDDPVAVRLLRRHPPARHGERRRCVVGPASRAPRPDGGRGARPDRRGGPPQSSQAGSVASSTDAASRVPGTIRLLSMNSATSLSFRRITRPKR